MIRFTGRHMSGGNGNEHVAALKWVNPATGETGGNDVRPTLIDWVRANPNQAFVEDSSGRAYVGVVDARPPYLRTFADGRWTDNLLSLPTY